MKVDNIKPQVVRFVIPNVHMGFIPTSEFGVRHWPSVLRDVVCVHS